MILWKAPVQVIKAAPVTEVVKTVVPTAEGPVVVDKVVPVEAPAPAVIEPIVPVEPAPAAEPEPEQDLISAIPAKVIKTLTPTMTSKSNRMVSRGVVGIKCLDAAQRQSQRKGIARSNSPCGPSGNSRGGRIRSKISHS